MITICSRAIFAKQSSEYRVNSNEKSILSVVKRIGIVYTVINERETDFVQKREGGICMKTGIFYIDKTDFIREWWEYADKVTLITRPRRF